MGRYKRDTDTDTATATDTLRYRTSAALVVVAPQTEFALFALLCFLLFSFTFPAVYCLLSFNEVHFPI